MHTTDTMFDLLTALEAAGDIPQEPAAPVTASAVVESTLATAPELTDEPSALSLSDINLIHEGRATDRHGEGLAAHPEYPWTRPPTRAQQRIQLNRLIVDRPDGRTVRYGEVLINVATDASRQLDWTTAVPTMLYLPVYPGSHTQADFSRRTHTRHTFWQLPCPAGSSPYKNIVLTLRVEYGANHQACPRTPVQELQRIGNLLEIGAPLKLKRLEFWKLTKLNWTVQQRTLLELFLGQPVPYKPRGRVVSLAAHLSHLEPGC